jgi:ankyrin repeat protein
VDRKRLEMFPLAFYAAQHWVDHAKYEDVASRIQDIIEQLFNPSKPYLAAWTWIHDVDHLYLVRKTIHDLEERPIRPEATALYYAVLCGFSGLVNYLIVAHAENVNAECGNRGTPLHAASYNGHLDAARVLLARGADVNTANKYGTVPLCSAYEGGYLDVMRLLLEHGANADVGSYKFGLILHQASCGGQADIVHLLLQHNADATARGRLNQTALHFTSSSYCGGSRTGQARVTELLLEHGAVVDAQTRGYGTPLCRASESGHLEVVQVLLRHGADVHIRRWDNRTLFQMATSNGHVEVAQLLLEHGAEKE